MEDLLDRGTVATLKSPKSWHPDWLLQEENMQLPGVGTLYQVKQNARCVDCVGPEEQIRKLKPYVNNKYSHEFSGI